MSVSVVIPTFNRRRLLERALRSVFAQSAPAQEVIVVDDGSSDGTGDLVGEMFPEARYFYQRNSGVSAARNRGIRESNGEWIALLDSDDEWRPEKLERQLAGLSKNPGTHLCHCDEIWVRRGVRVNQGRRHEKSGGHIFQKCLPLCMISPSSAVIRRSIFDEIGLFDEDLPACEDYDFWLRFCARHPVLYIAEPLVIKHGGRGDQLSRRIEGLDQYRIRALQRIVRAGQLAPDDLREALRVLVEKARIFASGARKRGRSAEADRLLRVAEHHQRLAGVAAEEEPL